MNKKITSALAFIMIIAFGSSKGQLAGNYTIGGTAPDYATVTDAVNDLNLVGISAPVVFNIRDGVYTGKIVLDSIGGATFTNTITFQSENGDSSLVTLTDPSSGTGVSNYLISMVNADYFTFHQVTLERSGIMPFSHVIELSGGCDYNNFTNCVIQSGSVSQTSNSAALVFSFANSNVGDNYNVFANNRLENGSFAFYLLSSPTTVIEDGNMIMDNIINGQYNYGMQVGSQSECMIEGNYLTTSSSSYGNAIALSIISGNSMIMNNRIELPVQGTGISLSQSDAGAGSEIMIANNFVSVGGTAGQAYGIRTNGCSNTGVYFNNVNITSTVAANNYAFNADVAGTNLNVTNNVFISNTGYVVGNSNNAITSMDHNDLFKTAAFDFATVGTTIYTTFTTWKTATGFDSNSENIDPLFVSATDLHIQTFGLNGLAVPVAMITTDIDGETRDLLLPDIGADETFPPGEDVGVSKLLKPINVSCGSSNMIVSAIIKNYAASPQVNINVTAEVSGTQTATLTGVLAGPLGYNKTDTIFFTPPLNTANGDSLIIKLYTLLPNDLDNSNDTLEVDSIYINAIPAAPSVPASVTTCLNSPVSLNATFPSSQLAFWYANPTGGLPLFTGNPYLVNPPDTTIYYVEVRDTVGGISSDDSLTTMNTGGNGSSANFFDVTNTSTGDITVHYLSTLIGGAATAEVFYLPGGLTSCTANPDIATFTTVGSVAVNGLGGAGSPFTFIPLNLNVVIPAGQTYAFCISAAGITYTNGTGTGTCPVFASNSVISIHEGFGGTTTGPIANRRLNGVVTYSTDGSCASDRVPVQVNVIPATAVFLGNDTTISAPNTITLDAGAGFATYLWSNGATTQTITVGVSGTYVVTVTDLNGCQNSDIILVVVITGINDFGANSEVILSPVPAKDYLKVTLKNLNAADYTISLLNNLGQRIYTEAASVHAAMVEKTFSMAGYQKGVYYVEVKSDKGIYRQRILKQ